MQSKIRAETFVNIPSVQFLCRIQESPTLDGFGNVILSEDDRFVFRKLGSDNARRQMLVTAIENFNAAGRRKERQ